ncbi:MAG TPA: NAD(P)/FAD-dependent oxidoreductase [Nocardioidaceae bacterium]|nr:NAD(P)/FAD-dependent oxidoreductase [Nocardioidaceae bacterium]
MTTEVRVAIIGTGFGGLGVAMQLRRAGEHDFVLLERSDDVGGTWRDNHYPGAACDVPSHLYSFSFAPNADWSRSFSGQREILDYLRRCAREYGVLEKVRFGHEVLEAEWDEDAQRWRVETSGGSFRAQVLVSAAGPLSDPVVPKLPGLEAFEGPAFHSAAWDHSVDLTGKRVAVVGTGASAIQFVPEIQPRVARLHVFQRTPPWVIPRHDRAYRPRERWAFRHVPGVQKASRTAIYWTRESFVLGFAIQRRLLTVMARAARRQLESQVPDASLRAKLTPDYTIGCKRVLISSDYYPAITRPNAEVVTDGIAEVRPGSIVTTDGAEREIDAIVFGTGFRTTDLPITYRIRGRLGPSLAQAWAAAGMQAYRGTTVHGFPNLFFVVGPNTGLGHTSMVFMIESQVSYILDALRQMSARDLGSVEVEAPAQESYNARLQDKMAGTVWTEGGCASWYLDERGRNSTLWPRFTFGFRALTRSFDLGAYRTQPARRRPSDVPAASPHLTRNPAK